MIGKRRPPYIERGGTQDIANPFRLLGAQLSSFAFQADRAALDALLEDQLSRAARHASSCLSLTRYRFRAMAPYVLLAVTKTERVVSRYGYLPEVDVAFWIPVWVERCVGRLPVCVSFGFYQPYLFVDSGEAAATGRETYGYHKMLGRFLLPDDPADVRRVECRTLCTDHVGPTSPIEEQLLFGVERIAPTGKPAGLIPPWAERLLDALVALPGPRQRCLLRWTARLGLNGVPQVFLKQFRSIEDPRRAAYQAVSRTKTPLSRLRRVGTIEGDFRLRIADKESHPLRRDLGLPAGELTPLDQRYAVFDFRLGRGRTLVEV